MNLPVARPRGMHWCILAPFHAAPPLFTISLSFCRVVISTFSQFTGPFPIRTAFSYIPQSNKVCAPATVVCLSIPRAYLYGLIKVRDCLIKHPLILIDRPAEQIKGCLLFIFWLIASLVSFSHSFASQ